MEFISFAKDAFEALKKKKKKCRLQREVTETPGYTALPPLCPVRAAHQKYSSFNYDLVISKINYFPENEECVGGIGKRESSQVSFPEGHRAPRLGGRRGRLRHKTSGGSPSPFPGGQPVTCLAEVPLPISASDAVWFHLQT